MHARPTVIVMVKTPRVGRVKTRLAREIGVVPATWWFRHQSQALLRRLRDRRWRLVLAMTPDPDVFRSRVWPVDLDRIPQGGGDLGQRMARVLGRAPGPVCVIGADIPGVTPAHLARAFDALGSHQAVFGPATDGGYWLVGLKHPKQAPKGMFRSVRWSTQHALSDSIASLPGHRIALVDTLQDVDTALDLHRIAFGGDAGSAP